MKSRKERIGLIISIDKEGRGGESAGIILNKKERKTYGFFFDVRENLKTGDKVKYKLNKITGVAYEIRKIGNGR